MDARDAYLLAGGILVALVWLIGVPAAVFAGRRRRRRRRS
jgi:hypothetical protein